MQYASVLHRYKPNFNRKLFKRNPPKQTHSSLSSHKTKTTVSRKLSQNEELTMMIKVIFSMLIVAIPSLTSAYICSDKEKALATEALIAKTQRETKHFEFDITSNSKDLGRAKMFVSTLVEAYSKTLLILFPVSWDWMIPLPRRYARHKNLFL